MPTTRSQGAEQEFTKSEADLRRGVDSIPAMAWLANPDGSAEFISRQWLDFTGLSFEQATGWGWRDALHPDEAVRVANWWKTVLTETRPANSKPHTKAWAGKIGSFDGYVFVTPEYNHGISGALKNAIDLNWILGVALFMLTLTFAFTGYSLVYDQLSYWATTVGTNMIGAIPGIGKPLLYLLRGGPEVNPNTLSRFYDFHIGVLPTLMTLTIGAHLALVRLHGVAPLPGDPRPET